MSLILDYRDECGLANKYWENRQDNVFTQRCQNTLQTWVTKHVSTILATTESTAEALRRHVSASGRDTPVHCVYNGFDPDDFRADAPQEVSEQRLRISHVGTLWRLTTVNPLVSAVERLAASNPELARLLDVELVGRCTPAESEAIERLHRLSCRVLRREYVNHSTAVDIMQRSDELCLLLANLPGAERVVPGKTFECLASQRHILAIAPQGETPSIFSEFPGINVFEPDNPSGITRHLGTSIRTVQKLRSRNLNRRTKEFDRRPHAGQVAGFLNSLLIPQYEVETSQTNSPFILAQ